VLGAHWEYRYKYLAVCSVLQQSNLASYYWGQVHTGARAHTNSMHQNSKIYSQYVVTWKELQSAGWKERTPLPRS
jgi:hypothetical protein